MSLFDRYVRAFLILDLIILTATGWGPALLTGLLIIITVNLLISCVTAYCWLYDVLDVSTSGDSGPSF
ncbi:YgaP-like transmembrane domain [Spirosoma montaniterrae]|nr:YgaP-like transmembrane domain [Spirosoma montaniterrae]